MEELTFRALLIEVWDPSDRDKVDALASEIYDATGFVFEKSYEHQDSVQVIINLLDLLFSVVIAIMMFLCFFSLSTSMSASLYEQTKEIGVLRSIGVTKRRIMLLKQAYENQQDEDRSWEQVAQIITTLEKACSFLNFNEV